MAGSSSNSTLSGIRCLVTGANGFVGRYLCGQLQASAVDLRKAVRRPAEKGAEGGYEASRIIPIGDIDGKTCWREALVDQQVVIHLANRAHQMEPGKAGPVVEGDPFIRCNLEGTLNLAHQAVAAGVRRFIYLSSIKVNGEKMLNAAFRYDDEPNPQDVYAKSKYDTEQGLRTLCSDSGMELVIIRPPLVYGPGVKGNLATLLKWVDRGWPLPLGALDNQRDMISLENLVSLIMCCATHSMAAGETFLCCDGQPVSTPDLVKAIASARWRPARLFSVPTPVLSLLCGILGKRQMLERLQGSLRIDMQHTIDVLGWTPFETPGEAMRKAFLLSAADSSA